MKHLRTMLPLLLVLLVVAAQVARADDKLTKDQWQEEMQRYTTMRNTLSAKVKDLDAQIASLQKQSTQLDGDYTKCMDELYALVGSDAQKAEAYRAEIKAAEDKANELLRLSDADLFSRSGEVDSLKATVKDLWKNKLSLIPEFWDRLTKLDGDIAQLEHTLKGKVKMYTVRSWAQYRDCLWNISKKKDIYANPWLWPKIWQDNRDEIRDPDIIHVGQHLKIPPSAPLTDKEHAAARSYYAKKEARSGKMLTKQ